MTVKKVMYNIYRLVTRIKNKFKYNPFVAEGKFAYITLRSGTSCMRGRNELQILNITDIFNPTQIASYGLDQPHGLGVDQDLLFVADGISGLKIFNIQNKIKIKMIQHIKEVGLTYDIIAFDKKLFLISSKGLYQYDYSKLPLKFLSRISLGHRLDESE